MRFFIFGEYMARIFALLLLLCSSLVGTETILVSVSAYQGLVQELVGEHTEVLSVVPEGVDLHSFEPTPRHVEKLAKASIWFTIGEPFEERVHLALPQISTVDLREGIELIQEKECVHLSGADPHIWTNPKLMLEQLETIYNALKQLISLERYEKVRSDVEALAKECDELLQEAKGSVIVIAHGAYTYLCHEYGIEQLSLEYGEKEPTLATLQELLIKAKEHNVTTVFSLKTGSKKGINRVAELLHASIVELDPLSSEYVESMRVTVRAFHEAIHA